MLRLAIPLVLVRTLVELPSRPPAFERRDNMGRVVGESKFNAFVNGPGNVSTIGATRERFTFQ